MQAFAQNNGIELHQLTPLLDLVAVSIASDIVPIMGENRILAFHGLRQLNSNPSVGLKAIIDVCGLAEKGNHHERYCLQNRSAYQCIRTYPER